MDNKITFHEFVDGVAAESGSTKQLTHDFLVELASIIDDGLERDKRVKIADLGIFELRQIPATTGIHPQTGEVIEIEEHQRAAFRPGKKLESAVNERFRYLEAEFNDEASKSPETPVTKIEAKPSEKTVVLEPAAKDSASEGGGVNRIPIIAAAVAIILIGWWFLSGDEDTSSAQADDVSAPQDVSPAPPPAEPIEQPQAVAEEPATTAPAEPAEQPLAVEEETVAIPEAVPPAPAEGSGAVRQYTTRRGDNLWILAEGEYTNALYWPNIYRVNVDLLPNPDVLRTGLEIGIPGLQGTPLRLTRQDSLNIATGYYEAYLAYRRAENPYARFYLWMSERYK